MGMGPKRGADGTLALSLPLGGDDVLLPGIWAEDIGRAAYAIFKGGEAFFGRTVGISGEALTGPQMAATLTRVLGEPVAFHNVPFEVFRALPFPGAHEVSNMFQYQAIDNEAFVARRDPAAARALDARLLPFAEWAAPNKAALSAA